MKLEKLKVYGFKSFADKTEFLFEPGLTGFVGPNGCGKSNVVDAVRWVLGEQRPRALRGSEMADVIFKGNSEGRRSLGVAEVTITLSNEDRALPIEYDQVAITRRLYRSGESEYLINNQPCRLRDIRELLMDTGIGMDAYSIVEQGKIDLILQSNPKDRRAIFEEAAGISKYNAKRRAALAKLERVEQNLLRLGDTIEEVNKRLRSIRRQAAAARRYKEYAESLGRLKLAQALHQYHLLIRMRQEAQAALVATEDQQHALAATIERLEAERTAIEAESIEAEQALSRTEGQHAALRAQSESVEEGIRLCRERIRDAEAAEKRVHDEIQVIEKRRAYAEQNLASGEELAARLEIELKELEAAIAQARAALQELIRQCSELARRSDSMRTGLLDGLRQRAAQQNELSGLESDCRSLDGERQRLGRRRAELARLVRELTQENQATVERIGNLEREIEAANSRFAARAEERGELRAQIENLNEQMGQESNALSAKKSRRDLLEDLEARFEGVELGTQTLLGRQAGGQPLLGMVADLLQVDQEYALAIEAALGGAVQHLVADTLDSAAEAVSHLKAVDGGRTTLLPLDRLSGQDHNGSESLEHPGVVGRALDLVHFDEAMAPVVHHLLGDTFIVRDLESAIDIARKNHCGDIRLATLTGDVVNPQGTLTGGSPHDRTGLLSRKSELRSITNEIEQQAAHLDQLRAQRDHFITESAVLDTELEEVRQTLNQLNLDLATAREQASRQAEQLKNYREEDVVAESEVAELERELEMRRARMAVVADAIRTLDRQEEELKGRLVALEQERRAHEEQRGSLERQVADHSISRARKTSERDHLKSNLARLRSDVTDFEASREQARSELGVIAARRQASVDEIAAKEKEAQELIRRKDELAQQRVAAENRRATLIEQLGAIRDKITQNRVALREQEQQGQAVRLRHSEHEMHIADLVEKTREEHRQELPELHKEYQEPDVNWDELQGEMAELRRKLEGMGTVNLLAIEEQTELEQRADFLSAQEQDLLKAKHSLQEVIRKVNRQSRQLFEQTFTVVRENFQTLFRKLFMGGKADIILEPEVDVLEAGVEIVAKPPGKEQSRLSLLSGGEKALTAAALLLAIFKSRPSPFCILDEVDAALDDSNIGRFVSLLKEFVQESQFIIITHSKQTMSVADVLYGITMQEPGVSTHVAVKLSDIADAKVAS